MAVGEDKGAGGVQAPANSGRRCSRHGFATRCSGVISVGSCEAGKEDYGEGGGLCEKIVELESSSAMAVVVANVGARVGVEAWGGVGWTRRRELTMASYNRAERRRRGRVAELGHDVNGGRNARARDGERKGVARQGPRGMQWARREGRSRSCAAGGAWSRLELHRGRRGYGGWSRRWEMTRQAHLSAGE